MTAQHTAWEARFTGSPGPTWRHNPPSRSRSPPRPWSRYSRSARATATPDSPAPQSAPFLLLSFPLGVLADRVSRRRLMTMAEAFRALALAALPLLALQGWMSVSALAAIGFAAATGTVAVG